MKCTLAENITDEELKKKSLCVVRIIVFGEKFILCDETAVKVRHLNGKYGLYTSPVIPFHDFNISYMRIQYDDKWHLLRHNFEIKTDSDEFIFIELEDPPTGFKDNVIDIKNCKGILTTKGICLYVMHYGYVNYHRHGEISNPSKMKISESQINSSSQSSKNENLEVVSFTFIGEMRSMGSLVLNKNMEFLGVVSNFSGQKSENVGEFLVLYKGQAFNGKGTRQKSPFQSNKIQTETDIESKEVGLASSPCPQYILQEEVQSTSADTLIPRAECARLLGATLENHVKNQIHVIYLDADVRLSVQFQDKRIVHVYFSSRPNQNEGCTRRILLYAAPGEKGIRCLMICANRDRYFEYVFTAHQGVIREMWYKKKNMFYDGFAILGHLYNMIYKEAYPLMPRMRCKVNQ